MWELKLIYISRRVPLTKYNGISFVNYNLSDKYFISQRDVMNLSSGGDEASNEDCDANPFGKKCKLPEPPTNCCMSGCANCVWIKYAYDLNKVIHASNEETRAIILKHVTDPNMRAFLDMELRAMAKNKKN